MKKQPIESLAKLSTGIIEKAPGKPDYREFSSNFSHFLGSYCQFYKNQVMPVSIIPKISLIK